MFKKFLLAIALALPMLASAQTVKIGLVDSQSILPDLPAFKTAQAAIEAKGKTLDETYQKYLKEGQAKVEELQKLPQDTPQAILQSRAAEIDALEKRIAEFQQMAQQDMQKAQQEAMAPIAQQIQNAIQAVGADGGFTVIQEKAAVLYFAAPAEDITPLVRQRLGLPAASAAK